MGRSGHGVQGAPLSPPRTGAGRSPEWCSYRLTRVLIASRANIDRMRHPSSERFFPPWRASASPWRGLDDERDLVSSGSYGPHAPWSRRCGSRGPPSFEGDRGVPPTGPGRVPFGLARDSGCSLGSCRGHALARGRLPLIAPPLVRGSTPGVQNFHLTAASAAAARGGALTSEPSNGMDWDAYCDATNYHSGMT